MAEELQGGRRRRSRRGGKPNRRRSRRGGQGDPDITGTEGGRRKRARGRSARRSRRH